MRFTRVRLLPFYAGHAAFIHVPKTAGSAVKKLLAKVAKPDCFDLPEHITYIEYRAKLLESGINNFPQTFAVVRNPWDWHVSWYHYLKYDKDGMDSGHLIEHQLFNKVEFPDYIRWLDDPGATRSPQGFIVKQMSDWLIDDNGLVAVDHILRSETLAADLNNFLRSMGCQIRPRLRTVNTSQRDRDYRRYYDNATAGMIAHRHRRDIVEFGYRFNG